MAKGRKKRRPGAIHRVADKDMRYVIGVLKRLERRLMAGQQIPFLIATIEPLQVLGHPKPIANPTIASRGLMDHRCGTLRDKLMIHLQEIGLVKIDKVVKAGPKDELEVEIEG